MDEKCGYKTPTPADSLEQQIINPSFPKNEREWWASEEITRLRAELKSLEGLHFVAKCKLLSVTAENALMRADAERLDCGQIMIDTFDEFGEPKQVWHTGMNLRAAIDAARAAQGGQT